MSAHITVYLGDPGAPLVLEDGCDGPGIFWSFMTEPEWDLRTVTAPPSQWVPGNLLLAAVQESATVPMAVTIIGTDLEDLKSRKVALDTALQAWPAYFRADVVTEAGASIVMGPWDAFPTRPRWGDVSVDLYGMYAQIGSFSVPVNPTGSP